MSVRITEFLNSKKEQVELSSQKIELGLIDEIKSEMKEANKGGMKAIDMANAAKKPAEDSLKLNKDLMTKLEKTEKQAKELGVNDVVKVLQGQMSQVKENISTLNKILDALYKI